jgi:outer membrane immunogenic protein
MLRKSLGILTASTIMMLSAQASLAHGAYKGEVYKGVPPCPALFRGWYAGIGVGYDAYRLNVSNVTGTITNATATTTGSFNESVNFSATGWVGNVFLGYDIPIEQWVGNNLWALGIEAFYSYSGATGRRSFTGSETNATTGVTVAENGSTRADASNNWGISLLPGYYFTPSTLSYIRLGWTDSQFRVRRNGTITTTSAAGVVTTTAFNNNNNNNSNGRWRSGFTLGFGMQTLIVDNWSARLEFAHTWYGSNGNNNNNNNFGNLSNNEGMLSVVYHFV